MQFFLVEVKIDWSWKYFVEPQLLDDAHEAVRKKVERKLLKEVEYDRSCDNATTETAVIRLESPGERQKLLDELPWIELGGGEEKSRAVLEMGGEEMRELPAGADWMIENAAGSTSDDAASAEDSEEPRPQHTAVSMDFGGTGAGTAGAGARQPETEDPAQPLRGPVAHAKSAVEKLSKLIDKATSKNPGGLGLLDFDAGGGLDQETVDEIQAADRRAESALLSAENTWKGLKGGADEDEVVGLLDEVQHLKHVHTELRAEIKTNNWDAKPPLEADEIGGGGAGGASGGGSSSTDGRRDGNARPVDFGTHEGRLGIHSHKEESGVGVAGLAFRGQEFCAAASQNANRRGRSIARCPEPVSGISRTRGKSYARGRQEDDVWPPSDRLLSRGKSCARGGRDLPTRSLSHKRKSYARRREVGNDEKSYNGRRKSYARGREDGARLASPAARRFSHKSCARGRDPFPRPFSHKSIARRRDEEVDADPDVATRPFSNRTKSCARRREGNSRERPSSCAQRGRSIARQRDTEKDRIDFSKLVSVDLDVSSRSQIGDRGDHELIEFELREALGPHTPLVYHRLDQRDAVVAFAHRQDAARAVALPKGRLKISFPGTDDEARDVVFCRFVPEKCAYMRELRERKFGESIPRAVNEEVPAARAASDTSWIVHAGPPVTVNAAYHSRTLFVLFPDDYNEHRSFDTRKYDGDNLRVESEIVATVGTTDLLVYQKTQKHAMAVFRSLHAAEKARLRLRSVLLAQSRGRVKLLKYRAPQSDAAASSWCNHEPSEERAAAAFAAWSSQRAAAGKQAWEGLGCASHSDFAASCSSLKRPAAAGKADPSRQSKQQKNARGRGLVEQLAGLDSDVERDGLERYYEQHRAQPTFGAGAQGRGRRFGDHGVFVHADEVFAPRGGNGSGASSSRVGPRAGCGQAAWRSPTHSPQGADGNRVQEGGEEAASTLSTEEEKRICEVLEKTLPRAATELGSSGDAFPMQEKPRVRAEVLAVLLITELELKQNREEKAKAVLQFLAKQRRFALQQVVEAIEALEDSGLSFTAIKAQLADAERGKGEDKQLKKAKAVDEVMFYLGKHLPAKLPSEVNQGEI